MLGLCEPAAGPPPPPPPSPIATTTTYARVGHARKLHPVIASLEFYDHNPAAWNSLRASVRRMGEGWEALLREVPPASAAHAALAQQRDLCIETLRVQGAMFQDHRRTCVDALRLRCVREGDGGGCGGNGGGGGVV